MTCAKCSGELRITHTYRAGGNARTSTGECVRCGARHTIVAMVLGEVQEVGGAFKVAAAIRRGDSPLVVVPS